jgi:predicted acetyltransferase
MNRQRLPHTGSWPTRTTSSSCWATTRLTSGVATCSAWKTNDPVTGFPRAGFLGRFRVAVVADAMVGRISIRHRLNDYLAKVGGHVGYAVVPYARRQGLATEMLRQGLVIARSEGVDRVLVTCDEDNEGSFRAIERCGGALESVVAGDAGGPRKRRYWID